MIYVSCFCLLGPFEIMQMKNIELFSELCSQFPLPPLLIFCVFFWVFLL